MLFDRFQISETEVGSILIIGGAGGVGSIAIQLLKSKNQSDRYSNCFSKKRNLGWNHWVTDHVIDHSKDLNEQIETLGIEKPKRFSTNPLKHLYQANSFSDCTTRKASLD